MRAVCVIALGAVLALPTVANAYGYGMAGCGLGSLVFGDKPGMGQVSAATTNWTFFSQPFGITSGTSNCVGDDAAAASLDQEGFVKINYASLMRDAAIGQGEYLSAFATLLGCEVPVHQEFFDLAKRNHRDIFTTESEASQVLTAVKTMASQNNTLRGSCARI